MVAKIILRIFFCILILKVEQRYLYPVKNGYSPDEIGRMMASFIRSMSGMEGSGNMKLASSMKNQFGGLIQGNKLEIYNIFLARNARSKSHFFFKSFFLKKFR